MSESPTDILFLSPVGIIGGAERVLLQIIASQCRQQSPDRLALLTAADGPLREEAEAMDVRTKVLPWPHSIHQLGDTRFGLQLLSAGIAAVPNLRSTISLWSREVARWKPRVVYSNGLKTHLFSTRIRAVGTRVIWHLHDFYSQRRVARRLLRMACRRADLGVAVSKAVACDARGVMPMLPIEVVPNGVSTDVFSPDSDNVADLDQLAGLPAASDVIRIGLVATYGLWKGQDVFLQAAARVRRRSPLLPVRFYLIGGPIYQTGAQWSRVQLQRQVQSIGLADVVGFVDFQHVIAPIYRALDVVVHASTKPEPFGLTIAEAMACGKPVIYSDSGGASEIAVDGQSGIATRTGNVNDLAKAMSTLVSDASVRREIGRAAREHVVRCFDESRFDMRISAILNRLIGSEPIRSTVTEIACATTRP